jgi:hypothetical protein
LKILWRELQSSNERVRQVAIWNLGRVGKRDKEARKILWNARDTIFASPEETQRFREAVAEALKGN